MRIGSTRPLSITKTCECGTVFQCADPKRLRCQICSGCKYCSTPTRAKSRVCGKCCHIHRTDAQNKQLGKLHKSMIGANNPSKRFEVRQKLSDTKKGDLNPARKYREQYAAHIAKYRPNKVSKLEDTVARRFPNLTRQFKVGWYSLDFADPAKKMAIEVLGCWHHSCPLCFPNSPEHKTQRAVHGNDLRRTKYLSERGWTIVSFWEHDIKNNPWFYNIPTNVIGTPNV